MCGIAGAYGTNWSEQVPAMTRLWAHRGPDEDGVWRSFRARVALGNRRLRIIDLSLSGHREAGAHRVNT